MQEKLQKHRRSYFLERKIRIYKGVSMGKGVFNSAPRKEKNLPNGKDTTFNLHEDI